jgi:hypothetical protein
MIIAYCDKCGQQIEADLPAGCRLVLGKKEWSWHLCPMDQEALVGWFEDWLEAHAPREVR